MSDTELLETAALPTLGIPNVHLTGLLGRGAFGAVYKGKHATLDVDVAVKFVGSAGMEPHALDRSLIEARLMARLDHPNLLRIYDAGRNPTGLHLVLEFMDGGSLEHERTMNAELLVQLTMQLLSGLQALHDARILHRDLKPANILRRKSDGRVKLADLGIAVRQATRGGLHAELAGTLPFMAPELFGAEPAYSARSELYALGVTLLCLALDRDPFPTQSMGAVLEWALRGTRPELGKERPDLPLPLQQLIARLLDPVASNRPPSAGEALARFTEELRPKGSSLLSSSLQTTTKPTGKRVGAWVLGEQVYESSNWRAFVAAHATAGTSARLAQLRPDATLMRGGAANELVQQGAARAAQWEHPGFVPVLDWGFSDGTAFVVTAPQGQPLTRLIEAQGPVEELTALSYGIALAEALHYLHTQALVYQAVEPGAICIGKDASSVQLYWPWFVVPAGTLAITPDGNSNRAGVPPYIAPEVLDAKGTIEPSVDVWGLGETLYYLLAGKPAFEANSMLELAMKKGSPPPALETVAPSTTRPTVLLIQSLLSIKQAQRPSIAQVLDQLRRITRRLRGE